MALGLLDGAWGAGLLIGSISGRRLNADREPATFVIGLAGVAAATAAIGISPWFAPIVGFNLLIGLADSLDLIAGQGIRQRRTPDVVLGRVIAANSSMCVLAQMVGYGASGLLSPDRRAPGRLPHLRCRRGRLGADLPAGHPPGPVAGRRHRSDVT